MKPVLTFLGVIGAIGLLIAFGVGGRLLGQEQRRFFEPRDRAIDRQVYEQTPSFVHGKATYIGRLRLQYESAEGAHQTSLRAAILREASTVDTSLLPPATQRFLNTL